MSEPLSDHRQRWSRFRFAIVGPLLAAPPPEGQLQQALAKLAAKSWRHPITGVAVQFGQSTIERWFYTAKNAGQDPVRALQRRRRVDAGQVRQLSAALIETLRAQYRAHQSWSYQLHYDNLGARADDNAALQPLPSYATVRRYMKAQGWVKQRRRPQRCGAAVAAQRIEQREVRSFEAEYVHGLWHLDFHYGSRAVLVSSGSWVKPVLLGVLDDHSRLVCHVQWYLEESARTLVHGLSQAIQKRALPRALLTDNGGAMLAEEVRQGLERLGIVHETTLPYSPYQNAKQEVFWASVEGRLMAMLEGVEALTLELLNQATQAWAEREYQRRAHSELGCAPLERYLNAPAVGRDSPASDRLRAAFRRQIVRSQRHSDGTVTVAGQRFELPARYRHLQRVTLRYTHWDLSTLDLVDAHTEQLLCTLYPLDKTANADGRRRRIVSAETATHDPAPDGEMAPLLRQLIAEHAATGLPPAYLPWECEDG